MLGDIKVVQQVLKEQNISPLQKLIHLKSYLEGEPLELVSHLALEGSNYEVSWELQVISRGLRIPLILTKLTIKERNSEKLG